jgi:hypothetical protein
METRSAGRRGKGGIQRSKALRGEFLFRPTIAGYRVAYFKPANGEGTPDY